MEKEPKILEKISSEEGIKQESENGEKKMKLRLSFLDLLGNIWKRFLERWELFLVIGFVMSIFEIILLLKDFEVLGENSLHSLIFIFWIILSLILALLSQIVFFYMVVEQKTFSNIAEINILYRKAISDVLPFLWIGFLSSMVILGMTFLFVIPGLLFVFLLGLSSMIYFCEHKKGMEALLGSWHYVSRFFWEFAFRMTSGLFLMLLLLFAFVGLADVFLGIDLSKIEEKNTFSFIGHSISSIFQNGVFVPLSLLFLHEIYKDMKSLYGEQVTQQQRIKRKRWLYLGISLAPLAIISLVIFLVFLIVSLNINTQSF